MPNEGLNARQPRKTIQSYKDLEVYQEAHRLAVEVHRATREGLPNFEQYEEGSQLRRAASSVPANIVEGFGRRRYQAEFIRFIVFAHASCLEAVEHLRLLRDTGSLDAETAEGLLHAYDTLGAKLHRFIEGIEREHRPAG